MTDADEPCYRFTKPSSAKNWHLLDRQGQPRCGVSPGATWLYEAQIHYPETEHLCRACLEPRSPHKERQVQMLHKASRQGLEGQIPIPAAWRYQRITAGQEDFLLRNGVVPARLAGRNRGWAAEQIFQIKGSIYE